VLALARREDVPLLERLKFIAIAANNLDEFYMVRMGGLERSVVRRREEPGLLSTSSDRLGPDGRGAADLLREAGEQAKSLGLSIARTLLDDVAPQLERHGITCVHGPLEEEEAWTVYRREIHPCLTPIGVEPGRAFPVLRSGSLNVAFRLRVRDEVGSDLLPGELLAIVQVPSLLPRFVQLGPGNRFVAIETLVGRFASELFPGHDVLEAAAFRVTRASDLDIAEEEVEDLLSTIEDELRRRDRGEPIRLELSEHTSVELAEQLRDRLGLHDRHLIRSPGPIKLADLFEIVRAVEVPRLRDEPFQPVQARRLRYAPTIFRSIEEGDVLLHHPYESFRHVVDFIEQAAVDPDVVAIKMTLYRTSGDSPFVRALARAAERGKEVTALVELKARFDEANNIAWARELEQAGVHVVYGLIGLKTHCKVLLVVRREGHRLRRYLHLGTGNYNPTTARLYTDISLITAHDDVTRDAMLLFNVLTGYAELPAMRHLVVAPFHLRNHVLERVDAEIAHARAGRPSGLVAQMNSLVDSEVIAALYRASQAGVPVRLLVRGICCLRPGVPGVSDHIQVRSVLDRFLEHSRIMWWRNGGDDLVYCGSADWMPRNLDRRIEVMFPVLDPEPRQRVIDQILTTGWEDNHFSWDLQADGDYVAALNPDQPRRSQQILIEASRSGTQVTRHLRPEVPAKRIKSPAVRVAEAQQRRAVGGGSNSD
jgi:polyphosphate kinase